jgi:hypothetical protein
MESGNAPAECRRFFDEDHISTNLRGFEGRCDAADSTTDH